MFKSIDSLNISQEKKQHLRKMGYSTVEGIRSEILTTVGIDEDSWKQRNKAPLRKSCAELLDETNRAIILTGNKALDSILEQELTPSKVVELCGLPGSGKTQLCLQLSVAIQMTYINSSTRAEAVYINTNNNFTSHRLREFATEYCQKWQNTSDEERINSVMERVHYMEADTVLKVFGCLNLLQDHIIKHNVKLIIVDSISYILRQVNITDRVSSAYALIRRLLKVAQDNDILVIITNDMTTRVDHLKKTFITPSFGESFFHAVNTRIILSKKCTGHFNASLIKSPTSSPKNIDFSLGFG